MTEFLVSANYVGDGVKGLLAEGGTKRRDAARAAIESGGGTLESMYYAFGDTDVFGIVDFPDEVSATAVSLMMSWPARVSRLWFALTAPFWCRPMVCRSTASSAPWSEISPLNPGGLIVCSFIVAWLDGK